MHSLRACCNCKSERRCLSMLLLPAHTSPTTGSDRSRTQHPAAPIDVSRGRRQEVTFIWDFSESRVLPPAWPLVSGYPEDAYTGRWKQAREQAMLTSWLSRMAVPVLQRTSPQAPGGPLSRKVLSVFRLTFFPHWKMPEVTEGLSHRPLAFCLLHEAEETC